MKKRVIGLVLCLIMVMMLAPTEAFASLDSKAVVSFSPTGLKLTVNLTDSEEPLYNIDWEKISGTYYLFLPADCDRSEMTVFLNTKRTVTVGTE